MSGMGVPDVPGYADLRVLGRGGFATVYRARQVAFDREVALKVLDEVAADERARTRFARECRAAGRLSWHPHVVVVHDAGETAGGLPYLAMELLPGGSLGDVLDEGRAFAGPRALRACAEVASALAAAHEIDLLHRDVKPANILVDRLGRAKLGDFGIARLVGGSATTSSTGLTGTVAYLAPEVLAGEPASPRSDIYALGMTLLTLLAGTNPYIREDDANAYAVVARVQAGPAPVPDWLPQAVGALVARCTAHDPAERPRTAAELQAALDALAPPAPPTPPPAATVSGAGLRAAPTGDPEPVTGEGDLPRPKEPTQAQLGAPPPPGDDPTGVMDRPAGAGHTAVLPPLGGPGAVPPPPPGAPGAAPAAVPPPPGAPSPPRRRVGRVLVALVALLLVTGAVAAAIVTLRADDDDGTATGSGGSEGSLAADPSALPLLAPEDVGEGWAVATTDGVAEEALVACAALGDGPTAGQRLERDVPRPGDDEPAGAPAPGGGAQPVAARPAVVAPPQGIGDPVDPRPTDPGSTDPEDTEPGTTDPEDTDPGATDPGTAGSAAVLVQVVIDLGDASAAAEAAEAIDACFASTALGEGLPTPEGRGTDLVPLGDEAALRRPPALASELAVVQIGPLVSVLGTDALAGRGVIDPQLLATVANQLEAAG